MIIVDTGFWVALFNKKDEYHGIAINTLAQYSAEPLITTLCVLTESCHLLLQRSPTRSLGVEKQIKLMSLFQNNGEIFKLFHIQENHLKRINELMKKYETLPMDLADASLVILAEDIGNGRILSIDNRDFNTYRWKNKKPFINLFLDYNN